MGVEYFLKLDGIKGDSTRAGHEGEIELLSWKLSSWQGESRPVGSGGGGAGKVTITTFSVHKKTDSTSRSLFLLLNNGREIPTGVMTMYRQGASSWMLRYKFTKLTVEDVYPGPDAESLVFKFKEGGLDPHSTAPPQITTWS
jgi:type VI secretion system secreted protein Hcp